VILTPPSSTRTTDVSSAEDKLITVVRCITYRHHPLRKPTTLPTKIAL